MRHVRMTMGTLFLDSRASANGYVSETVQATSVHDVSVHAE